MSTSIIIIIIMFLIIVGCNNKTFDYNPNYNKDYIILFSESDIKDTLIIYANGKYYRHTGYEDNFVVDTGTWEWGKNYDKIGVSQWWRPWNHSSSSLLTITTFNDCKGVKNINCINKVLNHIDDYYERKD